MPILSVAHAARLAQVDRATIRRKVSAGILSANTTPEGGKGIELSELLRVYPGVAAQVAPMSAHEQDDASAQGAQIAALERENELLRQELAAAKEREKWFQNQIDQIQQRLLPSPRHGIIERIVEAIARLKRPTETIRARQQLTEVNMSERKRQPTDADATVPNSKK